VYEAFIRRYPTPAALAKATLPELESVLRPLGLRWRAKHVLALGRTLDDRGGEIPGDVEALLDLPGVGPYAAAAFSSFHLGRRGVIVDSNVVRLYGRLFGLATDGETRRDREFRLLADRITPRRSHHDFNYALLDFTRTICRPKPRCGVCPLRTSCRFVDSLSGI
jgi:A/G-specific adenine glycosylase